MNGATTDGRFAFLVVATAATALGVAACGETRGLGFLSLQPPTQVLKLIYSFPEKQTLGGDLLDRERLEEGKGRGVVQYTGQLVFRILDTHLVFSHFRPIACCRERLIECLQYSVSTEIRGGMEAVGEVV